MWGEPREIQAKSRPEGAGAERDLAASILNKFISEIDFSIIRIKKSTSIIDAGYENSGFSGRWRRC